MKIITPDYYKTFQCIASRCPDTCCAGWEVVVDPESESRYRALDGALGKRIRGELAAEDGETCFHALPDGRCPFLNSEKLCDIQAALGEEALCRTCHIYPRFINDFGGTREIGLSLSCPEAARIILLKKDKTRLTLEDDPSVPPTLTDLDADKFFSVMALREAMLSLITLPFPVDQCCALLLRLGRKGGKLLKKEKYGEIPALCEKFGPHRFIKTLGSCRDRAGDTAPFDAETLIETLLSLSTLRESWKEMLVRFSENIPHGADAFPSLPEELERNFIFTFIYRYTARAAFPGASKKALPGYVKLAVVSLLAVRMLSEKRESERLIPLISGYSREVEHDEDNVEALLKLFEEDARFSEKSLTSLLISL